MSEEKTENDKKDNKEKKDNIEWLKSRKLKFKNPNKFQERREKREKIIERESRK